jgi:decaprenylphospho-beta-D-erythro-pentofuranosid-2-ulose 2-reductase
MKREPLGNWVVLGSTSGIARALALALARGGARLIVAARDEEQAKAQATDLTIRTGCAATAFWFEATAYEGHASFVEACEKAFGGAVDGVALCYGAMPPQEETERDFAGAQKTIETNYSSAVSILHAFAARMEMRGSGTIVAISSVAGDRGRATNYTYGSAKAGLTAFLQGLRNRLYAKGVHVLTVKPGFVDTPMTHGLINPDSPLVASPERVASDIVKAIGRRQNVLYTLWVWRWVMLIICLIPEPIFKRMRI